MADPASENASRGFVVPAGVPRIQPLLINVGLVGCWLVTGDSRTGKPALRDVVTQQAMTPTGDVAFIPSPAGMQAASVGGTGYFSVVPPPSQQPPSAVSMLWFGNFLGQSRETIFIGNFSGGGKGTTNCQWGFHRVNNGQLNQCTGNLGRSNLGYYKSGVPCPQETTHGFALMMTATIGGSYCLYASGRLIDTNRTDAVGITEKTFEYNDGDAFYLSGLGNVTNCGTILCRLWNRQLSHEESIGVINNPGNGLGWQDAMSSPQRPRATLVQMCAGSAALAIWRNPIVHRRSLLLPGRGSSPTRN